MDISRRNLIRAGAVVGGVSAVSGTSLLGTLAESAVAAPGITTLTRRFGPGTPNALGYTPVVELAGEPHTVRTDLGIPAGARRTATRKPLLAFVQLSDVHVVDHQSPMRVEWSDRFEDPGTLPVPGLLSSAYRPHEMLSAHVADAMVHAINTTAAAAPVTGLPVSFAVQTGDNSDNCQYNEVRWNIDILDGATVRPDSGDYSKYEGVMSADPSTYDQYYWHPDGTPAGKTDDVPRSQHGFPVVKGLLNSSRTPFKAAGLSMPWYAAFGNHDGLIQGNFPGTLGLGLVATGALKVFTLPPGISQNNVAKALTSSAGLNALLATLVLSVYAKAVTPDANRRHLTRQQIVEEHFHTVGAPVGHGFTAQNRSAGTAYYTFDHGVVRGIVLDTVDINGYDDGSLDQPQFTWLQQQLAASKNKVVLIFSHHTSTTMDNPLVATGGDLSQRVLGTDVVNLLLANPQVIAWINGHTHKNQMWTHTRTDGTGGFWEINTASHIDYPQQSRLIELADNGDGTVSIFTTMLDHAGPASYGGNINGTLPLASLSRELAVNDYQLRANPLEGVAKDRNAELLVKAPVALA